MPANKKRIQELVKEEVEIVSYNPEWPGYFEKEKKFLLSIIPGGLIKRIEHFGSTAIHGMCAKPIIDMLIEIKSNKDAKNIIVPILKSLGYEYFWRPTIGNKPPFYHWFIKRNKKGQRTHHLHMVTKNSLLWDRLYFRDYLKKFPKEARIYDKLKKELSRKYPNDRVLYTKAKTRFIGRVTGKAKKYFFSQNI